VNPFGLSAVSQFRKRLKGQCSAHLR